MLRRDIQVNFNGQSLSVKIIHDVEGPNTSATCQGVVHKINRPVLLPTWSLQAALSLQASNSFSL